jgi:hypothetical protein
MCAEYLSSVLLEMELRVIEELARIPIGRVQRWVRKKVVAKIEHSLNIGNTEFILLENVGQYSQTQIIVHIWSSYPLKLNTQRIIGNLKLEEFETELNWDIKGKDIYKHTVNDIKPNDNALAFIVKIPTDTLRTHLSSYWHLDFVAYFQKEFCKTFKDIKLKFRQSDVNRLAENN